MKLTRLLSFPTIISAFVLLASMCAGFFVFKDSPEAKAFNEVPIVIVPNVSFGQGFGDRDVIKDDSLKSFIGYLSEKGYVQGDNFYT